MGAAQRKKQRRTYSHAPDVRPVQLLQNRAYTLWRQLDLGGDILAAGGPHGADPDVVCAGLHRLPSFGGARHRDADDGVGSEQLAGEGEGQVGLADVDAVRACS